MSGPPERTDDGRHLVIGGRRWRASDPDLPGALRDELVHELMAARREVGAGGRADDGDRVAAARARVHDAKVALGERGRPWWEPPDDEADRGRAGAAARALGRARAARPAGDEEVGAADRGPGTVDAEEVAAIVASGRPVAEVLDVARSAVDEVTSLGARVETGDGSPSGATEADGTG